MHVIPSSSLYVSTPPPHYFGSPANPKEGFPDGSRNWLTSRFHFSFAEYRGSHPSFGVLNVCNDDLVQAQRGFGAHPHRNMEIVTYVVDGELTHEDSMGTSETLGRHSVQFMTAGTGVRHSERNESPDRPVRFVQMWLQPRSWGLRPNYGSMDGATVGARVKEGWTHIVTDVAGTKGSSLVDVPVKINTDVNMYAADVSGDKVLPLKVAEGRQAYMVCLEGTLTVEGTWSLAQHDAAEIKGPFDGVIRAGSGKGTAEDHMHVLLVEMMQSADTRSGAREL